METLELNGVRYIKASKIARELGYTSDYVGQLCRAGKIDAQLVGRSWYVAEGDLKDHRASKKRSAKEYQRRAISEMRDNLNNQDKNYLRDYAPSQYEPDEADLLPSVEKRSATIEVDLANAVSLEVEQAEQSYEIATEELVTPPLQGKLEIVALEEGEGEAVESVDSTPNHIESSQTVHISQTEVVARPQVAPVEHHLVRHRHKTPRAVVRVSARQASDTRWEYVSIAVAVGCLTAALSFSLSSTAQFSSQSETALATSFDVDFSALAAALNIVK